MAVETICQTPGAIFETEINGNLVSIKVKLPFELSLSDSDAILLEANLHNAVELVMRQYFAYHAYQEATKKELKNGKG